MHGQYAIQVQIANTEEKLLVTIGLIMVQVRETAPLFLIIFNLSKSLLCLIFKN